ncbi:glycine betaine ABC transporter substrate-binding protein [Pseudomonas aeruginosa]|uniref:glycine betaine ABC transporter substrate-binding protein n=1 Tax=Pseudomonas aeruginosa TaxID=287 RepID=UPI000F513623|nr:glycine betaine ABC transporter substrate-binding protein [Pseudomonas aeruginosa]AYW64660.1 glycine betaine ABC transporter substrate-binding protein [Pseudomonas aeruginosa]
MNRLIRSLCLACAGLLAAGLAQAETLRIGGKTFTEQRILTAITAQFLQKRGYDVTVTTGLGSTLARAAQESGQLDIVWEYTGSSLIVYNHIDEKLDAAASYRRVKQLDEAQGLVWLKPTRFNNTYALAMPEEQAERLGIQSVSDLARVLAEQQEAEPGSTHLFAMDPEFAGRPDGLGPMSELYGLHFTRNDIRQMDAGLVYTALKNRQVFLGLVYTTDGRNAAPVVRKEVMQRHPEFATLFDPIIERLDDATMQALNARVDIEQQTPQKVAADFLREHRLLDDGQAGQGGSQ